MNAEQLVKLFNDKQGTSGYKLICERLTTQEIGIILEKTREALATGGLKREDGEKRTAGGVFFYIAKGLYGGGVAHFYAEQKDGRWKRKRKKKKKTAV